MFSLNNLILLGCIDPRGLMMKTLRVIQKFQKKLGSIIISSCRNSAIKLSLDKFHKGFNEMGCCIFVFHKKNPAESTVIINNS